MTFRLLQVHMIMMLRLLYNYIYDDISMTLRLLQVHMSMTLRLLHVHMRMTLTLEYMNSFLSLFEI